MKYYYDASAKMYLVNVKKKYLLSFNVVCLFFGMYIKLSREMELVLILILIL